MENIKDLRLALELLLKIARKEGGIIKVSEESLMVMLGEIELVAIYCDSLEQENHLLKDQLQALYLKGSAILKESK